MKEYEKKITERFLEYAAYHTTSSYSSDTTPSTAGQRSLALLLKSQCEALGFDSVTLSDDGYLYCFLKGNTDSEKSKRSVGFIAHMDTSPDFCGKSVNARVVRYDGGDIRLLNGDVTLSPKRFPSLNSYIGQDLIVTDGSTLLGADDKAGIAAIMFYVEHTVKNNVPRPDIYVAFTPDEEIGRGMDKFDLSLFKADFAYTIDGGAIGELEYESFNAARATVKIKGDSVHPGYAKNIMKNAVLAAYELIGMLPKNETPAKTEGYEGYYHVCGVEAEVAAAVVTITIRDFDKAAFERRKAFLADAVNTLNDKWGDIFTLSIRDEYYNMGDIISKDLTPVNIAKNAYEALGITPVIKPVRGGTDGSRLSFMGIPCPNIFAGGHNFHGPYEYLPVSSLLAASEVIKKIAELSL